MKIKLTIFLLALSITSVPAIAATNPKAGSTCKPEGTSQVYKGLKFTCVKSGKKLVWDKGVKEEVKVAIGPENYVFSNLCDRDPFVPQEWKEMHEMALRNYTCTGGFRYVAGPTNFVTPNASITPTAELKNVEICKLKNSNDNPYRGIPMPSYFFKPTVRANIQMLAVSFPDALANGNPYVEHEKEIKLFLDTLVNSSDVPINPEFRKVDKYLKMPKNVEEYRLFEHQPNMQIFSKDVVGLWDSEINFSDVDYVFIVAPTSLVIQQFNRAIWKDFPTNEKRINSAFVAGPLKSDGTNRNSQYAGMTQDQWLPQMPFAMIHEGIFHLLGLDDHTADEKYLDPHNIAPFNTDELGTGRWGNMSTMVGDILIWDKWTVGFIDDSQVRCVDTSKSSTHWLRPGSSKGIFEKLLVIPLSNSKAIVVESRRSTGLNYLYPKATEGALVYVVDTLDPRFRYGIYVKRPNNRPESQFAYGFSLGDAALKKGESIQLSGFKISVVDAGDFGDVVKVEKV